MNKRNVLFAAILFLLCSCGEKKKSITLQPVSVKVETITEEYNNTEQSFSGTIEELSGTSLSFATNGTIKSLLIEEGQMVRQGQIIGIIDDTSLRSSMEMAKAAYRQALDSYNRMKMLHETNSLPEVQWIQAQTQLRQALAQENISRKNLSDSKLYSPFSGYISEKKAEIGQNVNAGTEVAKLVKIDQVKVKISVPEEEINKIKKNQRLIINVSATDGGTFYGKVIEKGISADPMSRSYEVKAIINNPNHRLLPGMICDVYTNYEGGKKSIYIPSSIVQIGSNNSTFIWLSINGKAHRQNIITKDECSKGIKVISGLKTGDKIIISGQQKVCEGINVKEL
ncbi:MAG: efflux RND transporter periplasmic adaptor subunit [Prevotella sp.]|nr:efflux RND transporter periplasmic adaptor subunit [Prevotella sp.]